MPLGSKPKIAPPPTLPQKTVTNTQITSQAVQAGNIERRRIRRGQSSNILTRQGELGVATTRQAGLKTTFG